MVSELDQQNEAKRRMSEEPIKITSTRISLNRTASVMHIEMVMDIRKVNFRESQYAQWFY